LFGGFLWLPKLREPLTRGVGHLLVSVGGGHLERFANALLIHGIRQQRLNRIQPKADIFMGRSSELEEVLLPLKNNTALIKKSH